MMGPETMCENMGRGAKKCEGKVEWMVSTELSVARVEDEGEVGWVTKWRKREGEQEVGRRRVTE